MKRWHSTTAPSYFRWAEAKARGRQENDQGPTETETVEGYLVVAFEPGEPATAAVYGPWKGGEK